MPTALKTIDSKGRLTLGSEYAGRTVQVEKDATALVVRFCRVVPEREAWLWDNEAAMAMVSRGIEQAHRGELSDGPDLAAAFGFADSIPDNDE
jgi:hypothetical protein